MLSLGIYVLGAKDFGISLISTGLVIDCPRFSSGVYQQYNQPEVLTVIKLPKYCRE